ncbi:alpha/beta hydrolase [SAR202 cluster bacterium AD-802-E10_MRT_200m]|nr:alpha/beta hydrolase [SAR202 cluster bacterium AD-802-E10_MRT_200m]
MTTQFPIDRHFHSAGLKIHYLAWGNSNNTPMILLHHIGSQAHVWDQFARNMSKEYFVLAMDMRGHGDSEWAGEGRYTTEHYASDVDALVNQLELKDIVMLGGSTGGRVALVYSAQHPNIVTHLIMEDVGAVRPASISQGFADRIAAGDPVFDTVEEWARHQQGNNRRATYEVFLQNARHSVKQLPSGKLGLKRDPAIQKDFVPLELWHYVEQITMKFLLMIGTDSDIVGKDQQDRFHELLSDIQIVTVEDAGHIIVQDQPEKFEVAVRKFLT